MMLSKGCAMHPVNHRLFEAAWTMCKVKQYLNKTEMIKCNRPCRHGSVFSGMATHHVASCDDVAYDQWQVTCAHLGSPHVLMQTPVPMSCWVGVKRQLMRAAEYVKHTSKNSQNTVKRAQPALSGYLCRHVSVVQQSVYLEQGRWL